MRIYMNQAGYLPDSRKTVILAEKADNQKDAGNSNEKVIKIYKEDKNTVVLEKKADYFGLDKDSGDYIWRADFSELTQEGYYTVCEGEGEGVSLRIMDNVYDTLNQILCKALYYQRCGMELEEKYAGIFKRKSCHEDMAVLLEDYEKITSENAEEIKRYDVKGGWHDAGDYGRYTTAAATALAHILYAYIFFPESFQASLHIPESANEMPDILNECMYELKWLFKMQREDGSVCHKLTSMRHANFVMPHEDKRQMILFPASTMATADFAAIMALAARLYRAFDEEFAQKAICAAERAWGWLEEHPEFIGFANPEGCNTGDYADIDDRDERLWASVELYQVTGEKKYLSFAEKLVDEIQDLTAMGWSDVAGLAGWAVLQRWIMKEEKVEESYLENKFKTAFLEMAEHIIRMSKNSGYLVAMETEDYGWGSNMVLMNRAMILATADLLNPTEEWKEAVVHQMDYLLGVNATGYSYITAVGNNSYQNPHNRVTVSDGLENTIPGFVVGGPNENPVDEKAEWLIVPGTPPMKCFLDIWECYSLNEITIYWNSPAIFLAAFLNDDTKPFETISSQKNTSGRFTIVSDQVRVNGKICPYDYLEMKEGVCILPIHGQNIVTLREYRYPIRSWQRELPGGLIDPGELPEEAAKRELLEETGYRVEKLINLGAFYPSFGSTNEKIHLFAAVCGECSDQCLDEAEVLKNEELSFEEFKKIVASGEFMHGAGLAAWARFSVLIDGDLSV
ncbi:MAG: glycoside hydrolase family 9 protein [Lachnospiraceae bacterium]